MAKDTVEQGLWKKTSHYPGHERVNHPRVLNF
jgi:hypothetical protein